MFPAVKPLLQRLAVNDKAARVRPASIICPQSQLLIEQLAHCVMQHRTLYGITVASNTCVRIDLYSNKQSQRMASSTKHSKIPYLKVHLLILTGMSVSIATCSQVQVRLRQVAHEIALLAIGPGEAPVMKVRCGSKGSSSAARCCTKDSTHSTAARASRLDSPCRSTAWSPFFRPKHSATCTTILSDRLMMPAFKAIEEAPS